MSIWCSWPAVGHDDFEPLRGGEVRTYAEGFSNHYPDTTGSHELPASVDLAHIAPWCVPGHDQVQGADGKWGCPACGPTDHDYPDTGPWLRLTVAAPDSLTWWTKTPDDQKPRRTGPRVQSVVMDEAAVRQLRDDLNEWLDKPKVQPTNPTTTLADDAEETTDA